MKKIWYVTIIIILLILGIVLYILNTQNQPIKIKTIENQNIVEQKINLEGCNNLSEWLKDYVENIKAYQGKTVDIKSKLKKYMNQSQIDEMTFLEDRIINASSIEAQKEYIKRYNEILEKINTYKKEQENKFSYPSTGNFKSAGVIYQNGIRYTWYSQNVLPGGGLNIPGRHVGDNNLIYDNNNYIVVASTDYAYGTVVDTPFGTGKVYDSGCASGTIDIYTNF